MNKQLGFIGGILVLFSLIVLGTVSYLAYTKNSFGIRTYFEPQRYKETTTQSLPENTSGNDSTKVQEKTVIQPSTDFKTTAGKSSPSMFSNAQQNNIPNSDYKLVNGKGYVFEAPQDWYNSSATINDCTETYIIDTKQNKQSNPIQINIWQKNCRPNFPYTELTEKGNFLIDVEYDEIYGYTQAQITEAKQVYQHIIDTFKIQ